MSRDTLPETVARLRYSLCPPLSENLPFPSARPELHLASRILVLTSKMVSDKESDGTPGSS